MLISKKEFKEIVEEYNAFREYVDKLDDLKIDIIESQLHEYPCKLLDKFINLNFDEDGVDWVSYYLYELPLLEKGDHVFDEEGKSIPLKNLDDLWEIVKDYRK